MHCSAKYITSLCENNPKNWDFYQDDQTREDTHVLLPKNPMTSQVSVHEKHTQLILHYCIFNVYVLLKAYICVRSDATIEVAIYCRHILQILHKNVPCLSTSNMMHIWTMYELDISMYSGHFTASINCCKRTFYCNDSKITEFEMIDTKNSSTAYVVMYKLTT